MNTEAPPTPSPSTSAPRVGLFVTCLADLVRPSVPFAAVTLLRHAGCEVVVPTAQTCCGQPGFNSGDRRTAQALARQTIEAFADVQYVVAPSGSCAGMMKTHYEELFAGDDEGAAAAREFSAKCHELVSFLVNVMGVTKPPGSFRGRITYHDSCSGLRELGIKSEPRRLLSAMPGVEIVEMADSEVCCGFGGTFCVKYPDISNAMVEKKCANIAAADPDLVLAGDLGCLMNMAGKLSRQGRAVPCRHVAEVLAGELSDPPIAKAE